MYRGREIVRFATEGSEIVRAMSISPEVTSDGRRANVDGGCAKVARGLAKVAQRLARLAKRWATLDKR